MPAIITHNFRRLLVNDFIESVSGMRDRDGTADTYYLFIGRLLNGLTTIRRLRRTIITMLPTTRLGAA